MPGLGEKWREVTLCPEVPHAQDLPEGYSDVHLVAGGSVQAGTAENRVSRVVSFPPGKVWDKHSFVDSKNMKQLFLRRSQALY